MNQFKGEDYCHQCNAAHTDYTDYEEWDEYSKEKWSWLPRFVRNILFLLGMRAKFPDPPFSQKPRPDDAIYQCQSCGDETFATLGCAHPNCSQCGGKKNCYSSEGIMAHLYYPKPKEIPIPSFWDRVKCVIGVHYWRLIRERDLYDTGLVRRDFKCIFCSSSKTSLR